MDQIEAFTTERELTPEIDSALRQIIAQKDAISKLNADLRSKQADVDRIFQDQERMRENMKALKGTPEEKALAQRYTGELNDQEMRLATLRTEISNLETAQKQAQQDLDPMIEKLTFDANL